MIREQNLLRRAFRAVVATALVTAPATAVARPRPSLVLEPYALKLVGGGELQAERGRFSVPEDRSNPRSRRIEIGFVRLKSTNPRPGPPLVYLAGGPGGSGVGAAMDDQRQAVFLALRSVADVIALDQRGTGLSNHFTRCSAPRRFDASQPLAERSLAAYYREALTHCVAKWRAEGIAVEGYTTAESAADIEDLRRALGVRKVDLWGISYGAHLALATMRQHPRSIERVVLVAVEGMGQTVKLPSRVEAVYRRMEVAAGAPEGSLTGMMRRVHARFDAEPQTFTVRGMDGQPFSFRSDSFPLRMLAAILPKNPDGIPQLAGAYAALDAGQYAAVAKPLFDYFLKDPLEVRGMPELIDIASGITTARLAQVEREAPASLLGAAVNFPMPQLRGAVPGLDLGDEFREEIGSNIPVLVLAGELDVRTPLEEQAEAILGLRKRHQIVVRNGGHDLFEAHPDVPKLMIDFFSGKPVSQGEITLPAPTLGPR